MIQNIVGFRFFLLSKVRYFCSSCWSWSVVWFVRYEFVCVFCVCRIFLFTILESDWESQTQMQFLAFPEAISGLPPKMRMVKCGRIQFWCEKFKSQYFHSKMHFYRHQNDLKNLCRSRLGLEIISRIIQRDWSNIIFIFFQSTEYHMKQEIIVYICLASKNRQL